MGRNYYVYILTNQNGNVMYVGVTNDLVRRIYEHKNGTADGFTKKYKTTKLVYFECFSKAEDAIACEKKLKGWRRQKKDELVCSFNPERKDLFKNLEE